MLYYDLGRNTHILFKLLSFSITFKTFGTKNMDTFEVYFFTLSSENHVLFIEIRFLYLYLFY